MFLNKTVNYVTKFLNSIDMPELTPHNFRNLNPPRICNGIRLVTKRITGYFIKAIILNKKFKGEIVDTYSNDTVDNYNPIQAVSISHSSSIGNDNEQYQG